MTAPTTAPQISHQCTNDREQVVTPGIMLPPSMSGHINGKEGPSVGGGAGAFFYWEQPDSVRQMEEDDSRAAPVRVRRPTKLWHSVTFVNADMRRGRVSYKQHTNITGRPAHDTHSRPGDHPVAKQGGCGQTWARVGRS